MDILEVGKIYKKFIGLPQGLSCHFTESGFQVLITFDKPTQQEIKDIKEGKIQLAMLVKNDILMMLFKFGNQQWMDCCVAKRPEHDKIISKIEDERIGYGMHIILTDVFNGEVKVLRTIGLDHNFSKAFWKLMNLIKPREELESYMKTLEVQAAYSTKELLKLCVYRYTHGK